MGQNVQSNQCYSNSAVISCRYMLSQHGRLGASASAHLNQCQQFTACSEPGPISF